MTYSRRTIIKSLLAFLAFNSRVAAARESLKSVKEAALKKSEKFLINNFSREEYENYQNVRNFKNKPGSVEILDLKLKKKSGVQLPFYGHTLIQNPSESSHFYTFEQQGRRGALIDTKTLSVIAMIESDKSNVFKGHAVYIPKNNVLMTSEHNYKKNEGEICIRSPLTLKKIKKIYSHGKHPHDCHFVSEQNCIVVANAYNPASISYLDVDSGKLVKNIIPADDPKLRINHFRISKDGWIVAADRKPYSHIFVVDPESKIYKLNHPPGLKFSGVLGIAFVDSYHVAITYPEGKTVCVWNYKTQKIIGFTSLKSPKGILTLKGQNQDTSFLVSLGHELGLKKISFSENSKELHVSNYHESFGGTGAHLIRALI